MVLVILAIIWVAVLVPPAIRARAEARPADSISAFRRQLRVLHRTRPAWGGRGPAPDAWAAPSAVPSAVAALHSRSVGNVSPIRPIRSAQSFQAASARSRTMRRRRDVLVALLASSGATLLLALVGLGMMLWINLLVDACLIGYVALLIRQRNLAAEREMKVRFLPRSPLAEPAFLRRSAN
ncbi:MAG TPA: hypothetical protein VM121_06795 [Acidimicrobiales bacterium]|nr:hypothetical protein [Acidimicrobiales bacterium]